LLGSAVGAVQRGPRREFARRMSPTVFERLAQRLLRESGFSSAVVTGRTGARRNRRFGRLSDLVAELPGVLPVHAFNPAASVRPPCATSVVRWPVRARRDFSSPPARSPVTPEPGQNAMAHRRIDLIDGNQLCDLLKKNAIGGTTTERIVEDVKVEVVKVEVVYFMSLEPRGNASCQGHRCRRVDPAAQGVGAPVQAEAAGQGLTRAPCPRRPTIHPGIGPE